MSCTLTLKSCLIDVSSIYTYLNGDEEPIQETKGNENTHSTPGKASAFFVDCIVSLSPVEDLLVIAKGKKAVFFTTKCYPKAKDDLHNWNEVCWKGSLCQTEDESISSVICVPLASKQRSSEGIPDCSCVIAGFTSGYVRIYLQDLCGIMVEISKKSDWNTVVITISP